MTSPTESNLTAAEMAFDKHLDQLMTQTPTDPLLITAFTDDLFRFATRTIRAEQSTRAPRSQSDPVLRSLLAGIPDTVPAPVLFHTLAIAERAAPIRQKAVPRPRVRPARRAPLLNLAAMVALFLVSGLLLFHAELEPGWQKAQRAPSPPIPTGVALDWTYTADSTNQFPYASVPMPNDDNLWLPASLFASVSIAPDGNLWLLETSLGEIRIFNSNGVPIDRWGTPGTGPGQFRITESTFRNTGNPDASIAWAPDGTFYVVDPGNSRVQAFSPDRTFLFDFDHTDPKTGNPSNPKSIAVGPDGTIYVGDRTHNALEMFDPLGTWIGDLTISGTQPNTTFLPGFIWFDSAGNLWIPDCAANRVLKLDSAHNLVLTIGSSGYDDGQFVCPTAVVTDSEGRIYATDYQNNRVQIFDPKGNWLMSWTWSELGNDRILYPESLVIDSADNIYLLDSGQSRLRRAHLLFSKP